MTRIDNITDDASQLIRLILDDGSIAVLTLNFSGTVERWTYNISYGTFADNGGNLCIMPNILRQFRNVIPFGLACVAEDGVDPFNVEDFARARVNLYVLNSADLVQIEQLAFGAPA